MASTTAESPAPAFIVTIHKLKIKDVFDALEPREKLYAHHLARAGWLGSRIIMTQISPESTGIFDLIMEMYRACDGDWDRLAIRTGAPKEQVAKFLDFAGTFLSNIANYRGEGDDKIVPDLTPEELARLASISSQAQTLLDAVVGPMTSPTPRCLGYPSDGTLSNYYPTSTAGESHPVPITRDEIAEVTKLCEGTLYGPENTRIAKLLEDGKTVYEVLVASSSTNPDPPLDKNAVIPAPTLGDATIRITLGDFREHLVVIREALARAVSHAGDPSRARTLRDISRSLETGDMRHFHRAQQQWVRDANPRVEYIMGFIEIYRDPHGVRAEWEAMIGIADPEDTKSLAELVARRDRYTKKLPWVVEEENGGRGPYEKNALTTDDSPSVESFSGLHVLAFAYDQISEAINVPNYTDIRETCGFKNVLLVNRLAVLKNPRAASPFIPVSEHAAFSRTAFSCRYVASAIHELLGHGSGKLLRETVAAAGGRTVFNFDIDNPPTAPASWYRPGQTYYGVFEDLAASVEECRAILVSLFLIDCPDLVALFGYAQDSEITADDLSYYTYYSAVEEGLDALKFYDAKNKQWTNAHKQGYFAILTFLLRNAPGLITIERDTAGQNLTIELDRSRYLTTGKAAVADFLTRIHVWRCTANAADCRLLYEDLTRVEDEVEEWRRIVASKPALKFKFVLANTFEQEDGSVVVREYDETDEGIVQSWAERNV